MNGISTITALIDLLANGLTGFWLTPKLQLITATFSPSRALLPADVTVATYTGYADKTVTLSGVSYDYTTGVPIAIGSATYTWNGPTAGSGPTVYGWVLEQPAVVGPPAVPEQILSSGILANPQPLVDATYILSLAVTVTGNGTVTVDQLT